MRNSLTLIVSPMFLLAAAGVHEKTFFGYIFLPLATFSYMRWFAAPNNFILGSIGVLKVR
jgi:hypothetical protein